MPKCKASPFNAGRDGSALAAVTRIYRFLKVKGRRIASIVLKQSKNHQRHSWVKMAVCSECGRYGGIDVGWQREMAVFYKYARLINGIWPANVMAIRGIGRANAAPWPLAILADGRGVVTAAFIAWLRALNHARKVVK